ncbi:MAG: phosphotransferase [Woeseiaceae bacterium]|nr:phosphotransferase [Woeseiaceae bacterium]
MNDFYSLSSADQGRAYELLAGAALHRWGINEAKLTLIKMRENAVFGVEQPGGEKFALRIHRAGYHSDAELRSELQWMAALDAAGISTPAVQPTLTGELFDTVSIASVPEPRQVDLLAWIDGEAMGTIEEGIEASANDIAVNYRKLGKLAGRLHRFSSEWAVPEGFTRHHWDVEGLVGEQPVWGRFWENERLTGEERGLIAEAREIIRAQLIEFGRSERNYGLIHADFLPENVVIEGDNPQLIDFDDAGYGWFMFELATSLFVLLGEPHFDEALGAYVEGYRSEHELPDEDLAYLPFFIMARLFTYLGWMHTRGVTEEMEDIAAVIIEAAVAVASDIVDGG